MLVIYDADKRPLSSGTMKHPVVSSHDGINGQVVTQLLYIRNTSDSTYYRDVKITPVDLNGSSGSPDIYGQYSDGFSVKLAYGSINPLPFEWDNIIPGEEVALPVDIGSSSEADTTTFYPIWLRISTPGNIGAMEKTNIGLKITAVDGEVS